MKESELRAINLLRWQKLGLLTGGDNVINGMALHRNLKMSKSVTRWWALAPKELMEAWKKDGPRPRPLPLPLGRPISSLVIGHRLYETASFRTYRPDRLKVFTVMKKKTMVNGRGSTWLTMKTELKRGCVFGYKEERNQFDVLEDCTSVAYSLMPCGSPEIESMKPYMQQQPHDAVGFAGNGFPEPVHVEGYGF
ncbi:hypothetical protein LR48_Vigan03g316400 [Vigna angularis]|uniref:Uncharacterized protein n=1 Tax=Phaseolus angularis TaxID=3914 RepID=A0A0L9UB43_PHAAN|nr:hypothetical protein LR48_Vigan03g316400 [Vigna angularis]